MKRVHTRIRYIHIRTTSALKIMFLLDKEGALIQYIDQTPKSKYSKLHN